MPECPTFGRELHTDRWTRLDLTRDDREGRTVVHAGALTELPVDIELRPGRRSGSRGLR